MKRKHASCFAWVLALAALMWTGAGESADPMLTARELPRELIRDCGTPEPCGAEQDFTINWLAGRAGEQLFLVTHSGCEGDCRGWVVEKRPGSVAVALVFVGQYRLLHVAGSYPDIEVRRAAGDAQQIRERFSWRAAALGGNYDLTARSQVFEVAGKECGTLAACEQEARRAARERRLGEALEIFESVHKRSWI